MGLKMEQLIVMGILIILIGFIVVFFGMLKGIKDASSATKVALGGFIGPIPFGFGSDKTLVWFTAVLSLIAFLVWVFIGFRFFKGV